MKFSICTPPSLLPLPPIWDSRVLSGHHLAAQPHFWSFLGRFSRESKSHPDIKLCLFRDEWSAKWRSSPPTAATAGAGADLKSTFGKSFPKLCFVKYLDWSGDGFFNYLHCVKCYVKPKNILKRSSSDKRSGKSTKYPKSNSHSQTKRPEPSDGFLKYLEDEVSVEWRHVFLVEHPQCAATQYGATTKRRTLEAGQFLI